MNIEMIILAGIKFLMIAFWLVALYINFQMQMHKMARNLLVELEKKGFFK